MHRYIQLVAVRVLQVQEFGRNAADIQRNQTEIAADAVFGMYNRRARFKVR